MTQSVRSTAFVLSMTALLALAGCVERTISIRSDPPGARVIINDEDVGKTPVRFSFLWYGDYEVMLRKQGYQTLQTHVLIERPWFQLPVIDMVAETLIPGTLHDAHELPVYVLEPAVSPPADDLVRRAAELRDRTLFRAGGPR